jgi:hypothetical protein
MPTAATMAGAAILSLGARTVLSEEKNGSSLGEEEAADRPSSHVLIHVRKSPEIGNGWKKVRYSVRRDQTEGQLW